MPPHLNPWLAGPPSFDHLGLRNGPLTRPDELWKIDKNWRNVTVSERNCFLKTVVPFLSTNLFQLAWGTWQLEPMTYPIWFCLKKSIYSEIPCRSWMFRLFWGVYPIFEDDDTSETALHLDIYIYIYISCTIQYHNHELCPAPEASGVAQFRIC